MNKTLFIAIGSGLLGLGMGLSIGHILTRRQLEQQYADAMQEEIKATKAYYGILHKGDGYETPEKAVKTLGVDTEFNSDDETLQKLVTELKYSTEIVEKNIFDGRSEDDVDYSEEDSNRNSESPYIISVQEYMAGEAEFNQVTVSYFAGDEVLCDDSDDPIDEVETVVGHDNLTKFGHRSNDANIVYVRNEKLQIDFEVIKNNGNYSEIVAGFESSPKLPRRKSRG